MYSINDYGFMIEDHVRTRAYADALRAAVSANSVVVDIGTGTGIFALLACKFGARRVYAIECDSVIEVAKRMAKDNGYEDRIEFIQEVSTRVELPERANIIVSDLPSFRHVDVIIDARQRFLVPDGVIIPQCDVLSAALVEAPKEYDRCIHPWVVNQYDLDMRAAKNMATQTVGSVWVTHSQLLVQPQQLAHLDYTTVIERDISTDFSWVAQRAGTAHGVSVWFDVKMSDGIGFSNSPGAERISRLNQSLFFPLTEPIGLAEGDRVEVELKANLVDIDCIWSWKTVAFSGMGSNAKLASFAQSSFFSVPMSLPSLRKQEASHVPQLNDDAEIDLMILDRMKRQVPLGEIARQLVHHMPKRFQDWQDAMTVVGKLSMKYCR